MKNQTRDEWEILDFSEPEAKVVHALREKGPLSVSALARVAKLPRSTANYALRQLSERRLVRRVSKGYASVWRLVKPKKLERELEEAAEAFGIVDEKERIQEEAGVRVSETSEMLIYRGAQHILKVYANIFLHSGAKRVRAVQTASAAEEWMKRVTLPVTSELNEVIKKSGVIVEAVLPEDITDVYRRFAHHDSTWARSFEGRTQAIRLVPQEWLSGKAEFFIFGDRVVLTNWQDETLMLVRDEHMVSFLKSLYTFMYEAGKPFDQNAFIRSLME